MKMSIRFIFLVILALSCNFAYSQIANPDHQEQMMTGKMMDREEHQRHLDKEKQKEQKKQQQQQHQQQQQQQQQQNSHKNEDGRTTRPPRRPDLAKPTIKLAMFKDLPAISCDVCKIAVEVMYNKAAKLRSSAPFNKIDEMVIENKVVDDICNYDKNKNGEWIRQCDVYEKTENGQKYLGVKKNNGMQKCDAECVTIAKSCRDLITSDVEYDKLGEALFQNKKTLDELQTAVCSKWSKRCPKKPTALPASYNRIDHPFRELSAEAINNEPIFYMAGNTEELEDTYTGDEL